MSSTAPPITIPIIRLVVMIAPRPTSETPGRAARWVDRRNRGRGLGVVPSDHKKREHVS
jgi:hypothetical protein